MLTIYRRHKKHCSCRGQLEIRIYVENDLFLRKGKGKCSCGLWVRDGKDICESLKTRDWQKALDTVRAWETLDTEPKNIAEPMTIQRGTEKFIGDATARHLAEDTIYKYRLLFTQIEAFAKNKGLRFLQELEDLATLDEFRAIWKDGPLSSQKKLEILRTFLGFCERRKWIDSNPALDLKAPKVPNRPTLPFTQAEMIKVLAAFDKYERRAGVANAQRLKAFVSVTRECV